MIDQYTKLLEVAAEQSDVKVAREAVDKLIAHLKSTGRVKMLPQIASELRKVVARRKAAAPYVEVASAGESHKALEEAKAEGIVAKHAHVNEALIHGWRARAGGKFVDHSAKAALIDIYKKVTG